METFKIHSILKSFQKLFLRSKIIFCPPLGESCVSNEEIVNEEKWSQVETAILHHWSDMSGLVTAVKGTWHPLSNLISITGRKKADPIRSWQVKVQRSLTSSAKVTGQC